MLFLQYKCLGGRDKAVCLWSLPLGKPYSLSPKASSFLHKV